MENVDPTADTSVDTAPLSPSKTAQSLESKLQNRPDEQDLKDRHILLEHSGKVAPALQAKQAELERQRVADQLKHGLGKRPEREDLIQKNILPDSTAAPGLQSAQRDLQKHMRADSLEKQIQSRPKPEELVEKGILNADENPIKDD